MSAQPRRLVHIYAELVDELAAKGIHVRPGVRAGYRRAGVTGAEIADAFTQQGATSGAVVVSQPEGHHHATWEPIGRVLRVDLEYAPFPALVRDLVIHELAHVLVTEEYGADVTLTDDHGARFNAAATRIAGALGLPSPMPGPDGEWPMSQRPAGFYGPNVRIGGAP